MYLHQLVTGVIGLPIHARNHIKVVTFMYLREQEEESLRAAIALSAVETEEEESKTTAAKEEEGSGDLLLDTSVPGKW